MPTDSTIISADAATRQWPVLIVGAGLAGAAAAWALSQRGVDVLLIDRATFPRDKTCGGCLNARAVASLDRLGLGDVLSALGPQRVRGVEWRTGNGRRATLCYPNDERCASFAVSRGALDEALVRCVVDAGTTLMTGVRALGTHLEGDLRCVRLRQPNGDEATINAAIVLAADGLGSVLARDAGLANLPKASTATRMGIGAILPRGAFRGLTPDRIHMACGRDGYVGVVGIEDGQWDVAAAIAPSLLKHASSADVVARLLADAGLECPRDVLSCAAWTSTAPGLHRSVRRPIAERLLLLGDASGYIEPITGEGMAWALAAVEEAVPRVAGGWSWAIARDYERAWRQRVAHRRWFVRGVAAMARRPILLHAAMDVIKAWPRAGDVVANMLSHDASGSALRPIEARR